MKISPCNSLNNFMVNAYSTLLNRFSCVPKKPKMELILVLKFR
ncbi:MAG: hypothetical protein DID92_2727744603 [Candidatus Nitrotoga sp. SPKER]|nr:MAG: hypothetical protein DID92_2727744603 [Candidatus Nitrotoga sp. SPKER]